MYLFTWPKAFHLPMNNTLIHLVMSLFDLSHNLVLGLMQSPGADLVASSQFGDSFWRFEWHDFCHYHIGIYLRDVPDCLRIFVFFNFVGWNWRNCNFLTILASIMLNELSSAFFNIELMCLLDIFHLGALLCSDNSPHAHRSLCTYLRLILCSAFPILVFSILSYFVVDLFLSCIDSRR